MELLLANNLKELEKLTESLEAFAKEKGLDSTTAYQLAVCLDELATNVVTYGGIKSPEERIRITVELEGEMLLASIEDTGAAFNPLLRANPDITADVDSRGIGGLGIFLVKKMMDTVDYERRADRNILRMSKKLKALHL